MLGITRLGGTGAVCGRDRLSHTAPHPSFCLHRAFLHCWSDAQAYCWRWPGGRAVVLVELQWSWCRDRMATPPCRYGFVTKRYYDKFSLRGDALICIPLFQTITRLQNNASFFIASYILFWSMSKIRLYIMFL